MSNSSFLSMSSAYAQPTDQVAHQAGLERHMDQCVKANGVWHGIRCAAESADGFMSGRFVSTVVVASALLALCAYW